MGDGTFKAIRSGVYFLLISLGVALPVHANILHKSVAALLQEVEPRLAFEFTDDKTGIATIVESGEKIDFQLDGLVYPLEDGKECFVGVLQFPMYQNSKLKDFFEKGVLEQASFKPVLFSFQSPYSNPEIRTHILDERALAFFAKEVSIDDILGEGARQVMFMGVSHYAFEGPNEIISSERMYVYDVPSLTERVAITRVRNIISTETVQLPDIFAQRVYIGRKTATTPPMLLVTSSEGAVEKKYSLELGNPDPLPTDTPWIRDEQALEARKLAATPIILRLQIVDSDGNPIAGAHVTGEERSVKWDMSEESYPVNLTADAEGRIAQPVSKHRINLEVHVPGYDKERLGYSRNELPETELRLTLLREGVRVPLRTATQRGRFWRTEAESYEVGLHFGESASPFRSGEWVTQREDADIWFVAKKTKEFVLGDRVACEVNSDAWTVTVEGLDGWELLEGPQTEDWRAEIREAPAEGYKKTATFVGKCNVRDTNIYLRYDGGKTYGILTSLMFADKSTTGRIARELLCDFVLQMEYSGRRSLEAR